MSQAPVQSSQPEESITLGSVGSVPQKHYRLPVQRLQLGMFVAQLDRPWLDTPFLLQGFLVDSAIELDTLRKYCRFVYVDLELSNPEVTDAVRTAESLGEPEGSPAALSNKPLPPLRADTVPAPTKRARPVRTAPLRADTKVTLVTRERFRDLLRASSGSGGSEMPEDSVWKRVLTRFSSFRMPAMFAGGQSNERPTQARERASAKAARKVMEADLARSLPPDVKLTRYVDVREVARELPRARKAFASGEEVLQSVVNDVRSGSVPEVARVQHAVSDMVESVIDNPDALMWVARLREEDVNTYAHGVKVALYMVALGRQLGLPKDLLSHLGMIGMLADVGKIKLPRALLEKPGMLSPSEHSIIKEHVRLGIEALRQSARLDPEVELGIAQHHERLDGTGYPKGLRGEEIGLYGRIAGIADSFSALITARSYANAMAPQDALMNLYQWAGTSFHEPLVEQFVQAVGVFPVGSLVELSSSEIAVVIAQNRVRRLEPRVLVLTFPDKRPLGTPIERDLFQQKKDSSNKPVRIARGLPSGAYGIRLRDLYSEHLATSNGLM